MSQDIINAVEDLITSQEKFSDIEARLEQVTSELQHAKAALAEHANNSDENQMGLEELNQQ